jgi:hypothetical protein
MFETVTHPKLPGVIFELPTVEPDYMWELKYYDDEDQNEYSNTWRIILLTADGEPAESEQVVTENEETDPTDNDVQYAADIIIAKVEQEETNPDSNFNIDDDQDDNW